VIDILVRIKRAFWMAATSSASRPASSSKWTVSANSTPSRRSDRAHDYEDDPLAQPATHHRTREALRDREHEFRSVLIHTKGKFLVDRHRRSSIS